jgi:uncharacterized membrane protein SpoIIM required for sporulation
MELFAHITEIEIPISLILFLAGVVVGFVVGFVIWGRPSHRDL